MLRTRHLVAAMLAACATGSALLPGTAGAAARLTAFSSCADLVEYAKRHALETIAGGPGQPGQVMPTTERGDAVQGEDFSSTNVQEPGVDEPDIVKTDGSTLFTVAGGRLRAVDARGAVPRVLGSLALPDGGDHQLLLRGERLLVLSNLSSPVPLPVDQGAAERIAPYPSRNSAVLTEVDVANPAAPRVVRRLRVDGRYLNARLTGSVARVMVTSTPRVFELPRPGGPPMADQPEVDDGGATLRAAIERSGPSDWVPSYTLEGGGPTVTRAAVDCQAVRRPPEFSGLDVLTVLTVDVTTPVGKDRRLLFVGGAGLLVLVVLVVFEPEVEPALELARQLVGLPLELGYDAPDRSCNLREAVGPEDDEREGSHDQYLERS